MTKHEDKMKTVSKEISNLTFKVSSDDDSGDFV